MDQDEGYMVDAELTDFDDDDEQNESGGDDDLGIEVIDHHNTGHKKETPLDEMQQEVLTPSEVVDHMSQIINDVTSVMQIPGTTARILLSHYKWDKERLMEAYYDAADVNKLFRDAHIVSPFKISTTAGAATVASHPSLSGPSVSGINHPGAPPRSSSIITRSISNFSSRTDKMIHSQQETCLICFTVNGSDRMTGLECGHKFCAACWTHYLSQKIMDEGMGQTISCAAFNCDILVDDATVMRLVIEPKIKARYQHLITNSFVDSNRLLRWCPSADCQFALKVQYANTRPVKCNCGLICCFTCGHEWHDPVKCSFLKKWVKKCNDDSETSNWIAANTKECPKCHVTIEKNGGCNHMTCRSQTCKYEFCWVCLGPWEPHGSTWFSCNRYDDTSSVEARNAQERSRAALQRYLHYCNRYTNHMQSLKFEHKLYTSAKTKMEQMQQQNMSWIEVQFLNKAIDILCQCRRTLMYTYVFAFYLNKNNQSIIFEDNQQDLEIATEQLSEFLERDLDQEHVETLKQKVQDKYRYCESRRKVLLDHCHEGDEKNWWIFYIE